MKRIIVCLFFIVPMNLIVAQQSFESYTVQQCIYRAENSNLDCQSELKISTLVLDEANLLFSVSSSGIAEGYSILGKEYDIEHNGWLYKIVGDDGEIKQMLQVELDREIIIRSFIMYDGSSTRIYKYH